MDFPNIAMIEKLTTLNFRPYGRLIQIPEQKQSEVGENGWRIVLREREAVGWRIAYLVLRDKTLCRLERHPESYETFEPMTGKSIIFVAKTKSPDKIKCFKLDRPLIVNKGIWHGVLTISPKTDIKITENAYVKCHYWKLGFHLNNKAKVIKQENTKP